MAKTAEGEVKKAVKKLLNQYGAYYHMPVVGPYGKRTLDFVGCYEGMFFAIETKRGELGMTPKQAEIAKEMREAGAYVLLVNEVVGLESLRMWLETAGRIHDFETIITGGRDGTT